MIQIQTIGRLAWFKRGSAPSSELKRLLLKLSLHVEDEVSKEVREVKLFEEHGDLVGIPRQMAALDKLQFDCSSAIDCTEIPSAPDFPDFQGTLRQAQYDIVLDFLGKLAKKKYGGILTVNCGGGKTTMALYLASLLKLRTLVLLHKSDLMDQWAGKTHAETDGKGHGIRQFLGLKKDQVGWVRQDTQRWRDYPITLALYQTVIARREELGTDFFKHFGLIIVDEAHHVPCNTLEQTIKKFSATLRIGLTATPKRRDGLEQVLFWHVGPILTQMKTHTLTGDYYAVRWKNDNLKKFGGNVAGAISLIASDTKRSMFIHSKVIGAIDSGRKVIVMTDRIEQVDFLYDAVRNTLLSRGGMASVGKYIGGMTSPQLDESKKCKAIIGTFHLFSEGSDVPDADTLILATPRGEVTQMVGRIQRVHSDKMPLVILDILDVPNSLLLGMWKKRVRTIKGLGFNIK
jgi:superfamily II DNA or RNA helicase